jgi:chitin disaccharide deacetylase
VPKKVKKTPAEADTPSRVRTLVVNADDFGATAGINRGVQQAHESGIVTSASLMVQGSASSSAAGYARARPELSVGLHADLQSCRRRRLPSPLLRSERRLRSAVTRELSEQLEEFQRLVGGDPTHLDSHHHRHRLAGVQPAFVELASELDVPLRHFAANIRFCGDFYGQDGKGRPQPGAIKPTALVTLLEHLPEGITELGTHPGYPDGLTSWYREERRQEVESLCDPAVMDAIARVGIELISFREVKERKTCERRSLRLPSDG